MNTCIVILNWNGKNDTLECLSSLQHLKEKDYDVVVVDNGSSDGSKEAIAAFFPGVTLLCQEKNLGFAGGCNVGIRHALQNGARWICLLNNDAVVDPDFLCPLIATMQKDEQIGILGGQIRMYGDRERLDHLGGRWDAETASFELIGNRTLASEMHWDENAEIDYVCGAALFARREVFEKIGLFEEDFFLIWEEADLCQRAKKAGFKVKVCMAAKIYHKVSASFTSRVHSTYFYYRNRLLWMQRNLSKECFEKTYDRALAHHMRHIKKLRRLKTLQAHLKKIFLGKDLSAAQKEKILKYKAAIDGERDFRNGSFGQGPLWIYEKIS